VIISQRHKWMIIIFLLLLPIAGMVHFMSGHLDISFNDLINSLFNFDETNTNHLIAREVRIPRMFTAIIAGAGLSVAGLLMQTLFNNPLAGPYVLGINSGASLFVAFSIMTGIPFLSSDLGIITNALIGAMVFGLIISLFSEVVRSQISLLLIGIMLGSFTGAIVSLLEVSSDASELKVFTLWSLGSLSRIEFSQIPLISLVFIVGIVGSLFLIKPLNLLILGQDQARLLGLNYKRTRFVIIAITAILIGLITAFCGPIAFVGLAVPNLVRIMLKSQHHGLLIVACAFIGGIFVLLCDALIQAMENYMLIPINVLTSIIGAPIVVLLILRKLR